MKILLVDDIPGNLLLLTETLKRAGYDDFETADSAIEAQTVLGLKGNDNATPEVDLILMDIMMPGMNGIEACRLIKSIKKLKDIPIIMLTAFSETRYIKEAFEAGASDFITRPVNAIELSARVRTALKLKEEIDLRKKRESQLRKALLELKAMKA